MDAGTQCPQTMTYACVPLLEKHLTPAQRSHWNWREKMKVYDERNLPLQQKRGMTIGMSMTERQGGSDVRANTTVARPRDPSKQGPGEDYFLNGHKWFTSAPMCDGFLTLAKTEKGLSCFMVPRWVPSTGERNRGLVFLRLKDKLGDRSNASSEVEYRDAYAQMVGEDGRGVATILEMVHHTRLDCTLGSAGLIRRVAVEAMSHLQRRHAFGLRLFEAPLMQNVLAQLAVESEAATLLALFIASLFDRAGAADRMLCRLATAVAKMHVCKRAPALAYEAMECVGGNGYIEDWPMAYLFRQAPLNAIWEGSGNVICLDVLRSVTADPECYQLLLREIEAGLGSVADKPHLAHLTSFNTEPHQLRNTVTSLALALQASLLVRYGRAEVAAAFHDSILKRKELHVGTLQPGTDFKKILEPYEDRDNALYERCYR